MRIVGGSRRGLRLAEVGRGDAAAHLRPTSDRVRESLFNLLTNGAQGDLVSGARVLDLFAGTGALGLEALSRGASDALFVDNGAAAGRLISENIRKTRFDDVAQHLRRDARRLGPNSGMPFDLVFLDPPYGKGFVPPILVALKASGWLSEGAGIAIEENSPIEAPDGFETLQTRRYGGTQLTLLCRT